MGPKKDLKKGGLKNENTAAAVNMEDPINTDTWKCVVVMAVEKSFLDSFVLKEFAKESTNRRRHAVCLIDYETLVVDVLNQFANGEISYKYSFLLNFLPVFLEAAGYVTQKMEIPVPLLVKVVKALIFYLKEDNLKSISNTKTGTPDPIKAMAERVTNVGTVDSKAKEVSKKGDGGFKVRPASVSKEDTQLLKRGEGAKYDQRIDDAPLNAYFNLYILLTGFYKPDFPLELIKAGIPLYGLICVDSSLLGVREDSFSLPKFQKQGSEVKSLEVNNFWTVFLKILWDPEITVYFRNTIFQVYMPPRFFCDKKKLREFIYREISFLLYDMSDLKRQLNNYLDHLKLWNVDLKELEKLEIPLGIDNLPGDCVTVPVVLQYMIDALSEVDMTREGLSMKSKTSKTSQFEEFEDCSSPPKVGSCVLDRSCSQELEERGDIHLLQAYLKTKELDVKYELYENGISGVNSLKSSTDSDSSELNCDFQPRECGENMEEALLTSDGVFSSYWKKYQNYMEVTYGVDYCLYALFMTRVFCSYDSKVVNSPTRSCSTMKKSFDSETIENLNEHTCRPRFTITEGSRTILRTVSNSGKRISRNFFCPKEFKIVSSEKLEASSALEFRVTPGLKVQTLFTSEVFPENVLRNPFESLRGFIDENLFSNTTDFDVVEFLNKSKLLQKERERWDRYNCIDHAYSFLDDSIFFVLHNRKDEQGIHHETFNEGLKTSVGFRDFYDYVMEDESEWLKNQEELHEIAVFLANKILDSDSFRNIADSDFWLTDSIKYQNMSKSEKEEEVVTEVRTAPSDIEKLINQIKLSNLKKLLTKEELEGYDVSEMAVQFSGLKTVYYSNDSYVAVQLFEKLYGNQDLGVHVTAASNTLHLYSYVCPEPHILDPFTFHLYYKNGIIIAFGRRFVEITEEEEEDSIQSKTTLKGKKHSSNSSRPAFKKEISKTVKDVEYLYDMTASLPNGLYIQTMRRIVKPSYIKQQYLVRNEETAKVEKNRLFLPNGNVVKMMMNGTVEILKIDTSVVSVNLGDLIYDAESEKLVLERFGATSGEGFENLYERGKLTSSNRIQIFQNTDLETNQVYFRRRDGTNYMLRNDGMLCMQFKDGTRISSAVLAETESNSRENSTSGDETSTETNPEEEDYVFVNLEITAEHPDYATVIYNTQTQKWKILLPYDSTITIQPNGCYSVEIDKQTELRVISDLIEMERFSPDRQPLSVFTADLSVFDNPENTYCQMKESSGKTFILNANASYRIETPTQEEQSLEVQSDEIFESEQSELVASTDLQTCIPAPTNRNNKLNRENTYLVVRRNITGVEVLHKDDARKELSECGKDSLVYTADIPDTNQRYFVLITPKPKKRLKKWEVETILPNPKYEANPAPKTTSSTYGVPPSWMHPFPKKKTKFVVIHPLSCRVFVETKKTDLSPKVGTLENFHLEIDEITQIQHSNIPPNGTEEFLKKLSNDDQDILKEMYILAMGSLINEKKKLKPVNSKKLQHYLEMSKYYVEMREYHKKCIRYNIVPNYFQHPAGMSWLILNSLLFKLNYQDKETKDETLAKRAAGSEKYQSSSEVSEFSKDEIEYNLSISARQSYSDLSYRSNLSAKTAPAVLRTCGVCRPKIKSVKQPPSSPEIKLHSREQTVLEDFNPPEVGVCTFQDKDIEKIESEDRGKGKTLWVSLEDLMHLGLV